jgi:hypothetical protein
MDEPARSRARTAGFMARVKLTCSRTGAAFIVDGMSSFGAVPISLDGVHADFRLEEFYSRFSELGFVIYPGKLSSYDHG